MKFKGFRLQVVLRIAAILTLGFLSVYVILYTHFWLVGIWTTLLMGVFIVSLIRFVERSNREMANFLMAIKQGDFTNTYSGKSHGNIELRTAFSEIMAVFQKLSSEKETNHLFLQTVVEHISTALITFDDQGEVISINKSAKNLLNRPYLKNLKSLENYNKDLYEKLQMIRPGHGELIRVLSGGELQNLSVRATSFILKEKHYKIVSLQDIKVELEEKEVESWQKLIRVLTHEIMNSAIPISTLSSVISQMLEDGEGNALPISQLDDDVGQDVLGGLKTIENRSKGLVQFVDAYKSLTKIDPPKFEEIKVRQLVDETCLLLKPDFEKRKVELKIETPVDTLIKGDSQLLEQVLINLLKNAMEALDEQKKARIEIRAAQENGRVTISISDNGPGIDGETLENIFVPFFSTKKKGSGIGLSLSRQIMRLHKGGISVNSVVGQGASFVLSF